MGKPGNEVEKRFISDINNRIDYFRQEYDISYVQIIGSLAVLQASLFAELSEDDDDEYDDPVLR